MSKFRFYQVNIKAVEVREYYDIEAESLEEAREIASECCDLDDCENAEFLEAEECFDSFGIDWQERNIKGIYDSDGDEV